MWRLRVLNRSQTKEALAGLFLIFSVQYTDKEL